MAAPAPLSCHDKSISLGSVSRLAHMLALQIDARNAVIVVAGCGARTAQRVRTVRAAGASRLTVCSDAAGEALLDAAGKTLVRLLPDISDLDERPPAGLASLLRRRSEQIFGPEWEERVEEIASERRRHGIGHATACLAGNVNPRPCASSVDPEVSAAPEGPRDFPFRFRISKP